MKKETFKIEITEILQRIIEVEADSEKDAYILVSEQYKNEEIILDNSDFVSTQISFFKQGEKSELKKEIEKLITYLWDDEEKNFEELNKPKNHIFNTILKIKSLILD